MATWTPSTVHIETEGESTGIEELRWLPHLVIARTLTVPEEALEPEAAIEPGAARDLHGSLHRLDNGASHEGAPDQDLAGRIDPHRAALPGVEHVTERDLRGRELVLHLTDHPFGRRFVAPLRRHLECQDAGGFSDADVDGIDDRQRDRGRDVHREAPSAGRPAQADGALGPVHAVEHRFVGYGRAHA